MKVALVELVKRHGSKASALSYRHILLLVFLFRTELPELLLQNLCTSLGTPRRIKSLNLGFYFVCDISLLLLSMTGALRVSIINFGRLAEKKE